MNVVALAGGVGGARLVDGLAQCLAPESLTVIVNIGDDFDFMGLRICPDLDTVCYTLAGLANPATGWGRADESWQVFEALAALGGPDWFHLGDRDLATHLERTRRLQAGQSLSQVTADFCRRWGVAVRVLPATDDAVPTRVSTETGELPFQEYFVRLQCRPVVTGFRFEGAAQARPAPGVVAALQAAEVVVFCPSNPWVSLDPILAIPGLRPAFAGKTTVAVTPIIGGQAVKGPAAKMFSELGTPPAALSVAAHYKALLTGFVFDTVDADQAGAIHALGIQPYHTDTLMKTRAHRRRLAEETLSFAQSMADKNHLTGNRTL